jgi:hypothetical protein
MEKRDVKNPGAYFMKLVQGIKAEAAGGAPKTFALKYNNLFKKP